MPLNREFKEYPSYKSSGLDWLGEIPSHWKVVRSKRLFALRRTKASASDRQLTASQVYGVVPQEEFMAKEGRRLVQVVSGADILKHVEPNDFVISMRSFQGGIELSRYAGAVSSAYVVLAPSDDVGHGYFSYLLKSDCYIQALQSTSNLVRDGQALRYENFSLIDLPEVPLREQCGIATFLDCETAKIDQLVAKNERLIDLLHEKRAALITRTVTEGLNANVPMKETGIEWLGTIPMHWTVQHLRWAITFQRGHDLPTETRNEGEIPVVSSSGISSSHSTAIAKAPGIVTGRYGTIGHFHLITEDYWPLNTTLYSIDLRGNDPRFLRYMLTHLSPLFLLNAVKSAVPGIDRNDIHPTSTAVPPIREQQAIADFLDEKIAGIEALITKVRAAVERVNELREALISASVTGKIDVRDSVPIAN